MNTSTGFITGAGKGVEQLNVAHFKLQLRRDKRVHENYFHFRIDSEGHAGEVVVDVYPDQDFLPDSRRILDTHFSPAIIWRPAVGPFTTDASGWRPHPQHLTEWHRDFIRLRAWVEPEQVVYFSSHHPITPEHWRELLEKRAAACPGLCRCIDLGTTPERRQVTGLAVGAGQRRVLVMAGEHPIETPGSWAVWGIIDYLTSTLREARALCAECRFECFPIVNPDGLARGNACFTSNGTDLFTAYSGAPERRFPAEEAELVWEWAAGQPTALLLDCHCYMGGVHTQDHPGEGIYTVPQSQLEEVLAPREARTYRVVNDRVIFSADPFSSYYRTVDLTPENLCYQIAAQRDVPSVMYEFNGAHNGPYCNTRRGIAVFVAAMDGLREES
jgi:hypothetical protein